jgi:small GTP-binding protein
MIRVNRRSYYEYNENDRVWKMLLTFELERTHPHLVKTILNKYEEKHNQKTFTLARQHQSFWKNQCRDFTKAKRGRMWVPKSHYRVDEFFNQDWYNLIDGFEFKLLVLGNRRVGKTSMVDNFLANNLIGQKKKKKHSTLLKTITRKIHLPNTKFGLIELIDVKCKGITPELEELVQACDGFVIVYDITDKKSFEAVPHYVDLINRNTRRETSPLVVVGNKIDQVCARRVSLMEGLRYAKTINAPFFESSAKEATNIKSIFIQTVYEIYYYNIQSWHFGINSSTPLAINSAYTKCRETEIAGASSSTPASSPPKDKVNELVRKMSDHTLNRTWEVVQMNLHYV